MESTPSLTKSEQAEKEKDMKERPFRYQNYKDIKCSDVMSSASGVGSSDFHIYRRLRRVNTARDKRLEEEHKAALKKAEELQQWKAQNEELRARTAKKALKRRRKKENMKRRKDAKKCNKFLNDGSFVDVIKEKAVLN